MPALYSHIPTIPGKLRAIADEITGKPTRWTQGAPARSDRENQVLPTSRRAVCWCVLGFLEREIPCQYERSEARALILIAIGKKHGFRRDVENWNDSNWPERTAADVAAMLRRAAEGMEGR